MMTTKGGGARRGPFTGKKAIFATRLTDETMSNLVRLAEREQLSISQKAEALLVDAIGREDLYHRLFSEDLRHFETKMKVTTITPFPDATNVDQWERGALDACKGLITGWSEKITEVAREVRQSALEAQLRGQEKPVEARPEASKVANTRHSRRQLDID